MFFKDGYLLFASDEEYLEFCMSVLNYAREAIRHGNVKLLSHNFNPNTPMHEKSNCYQVNKIELGLTAFLDEETHELKIETATESTQGIYPGRLHCTKASGDNFGIITTPETEVILIIQIKENIQIESVTLIMLLHDIKDHIDKYTTEID